MHCLTTNYEYIHTIIFWILFICSFVIPISFICYSLITMPENPSTISDYLKVYSEEQRLLREKEVNKMVKQKNSKR